MVTGYYKIWKKERKLISLTDCKWKCFSSRLYASRIDRWVLHCSFQKADHTIYTLQKTFGKFNKISSKNYLFKVNNRNTRTKHEIYSKLTINTLGINFTSWFCVFIVDFEQLIWAVSGFFEVLLLLILNRYFLILVMVFLNCWVQTGKCRKSFHNWRRLLSTGVNVQNVFW